jgi:hypothetical protein
MALERKYNAKFYFLRRFLGGILTLREVTYMV